MNDTEKVKRVDNRFDEWQFVKANEEVDEKTGLPIIGYLGIPKNAIVQVKRGECKLL